MELLCIVFGGFLLARPIRTFVQKNNCVMTTCIYVTNSHSLLAFEPNAKFYWLFRETFKEYSIDTVTILLLSGID